MMPIAPQKARKGGRLTLLQQLKMLEPVAVEHLAQALAISPQAVGQQLATLAKEGLVVSQAAPASGRGRPRVLWQVTPLALRHLPDAHRGLAGELLDLMETQYGAAVVDRLLADRTELQLTSYRAQMGAGTLQSRLTQLAAIRAGEGYMAEVQCTADGTLLLIEHHCPLYAAARRCPTLCQEEQKLFQNLLGDAVRIERCAHALSGASRCSYRIRPVVSAASREIAAQAPSERGH